MEFYEDNPEKTYKMIIKDDYFLNDGVELSLSNIRSFPEYSIYRSRSWVFNLYKYEERIYPSPLEIKSDYELYNGKKFTFSGKIIDDEMNFYLPKDLEDISARELFDILFKQYCFIQMDEMDKKKERVQIKKFTFHYPINHKKFVPFIHCVFEGVYPRMGTEIHDDGSVISFHFVDKENTLVK